MKQTHSASHQGTIKSSICVTETTGGRQSTQDLTLCLELWSLTLARCCCLQLQLHFPLKVRLFLDLNVCVLTKEGKKRRCLLPDRKWRRAVGLQVSDADGKIPQDSCSDVDPPRLPPIGR